MENTSKSTMLKARGILQKVTAMLIVFVIVMAEFSLVGSYAIDMALTNNENVEFVAYFENAEGEKVKEISSTTTAKGIKLKIDVTVGNKSGLGGYFDGTISLKDANFKLKEDIGEIHVDAGNTQTIEREIEFVNKKVIESGYMNMESLLEISGIYKNSKKDYDITGEASVKVNWVSEDDISSSLTAKILTNSTYKVEEANKKLVQVLVESKIENNAYPVKDTKIELSVPEGVEEVKVHKRTTSATNGDKDFGEDNYSYNAETGMLTINVSNGTSVDNTQNASENVVESANSGESVNAEEEQLAWTKNAKDTFVVSYIYGEDVNIEGREVAVNSTITTLDEKELKAEATAKIEEEKDGIVTTSIGVKEASIYKGKIYTGEERDYETETIVNIDYAEAVENLKITENKPVFVAEKEATENTGAENNEKTENSKTIEEKTANIETVQTKVNKAEFIKIFGENGFITIQDQEGNVVGNITKDSETDEEGNVVVKYSSGVTKLTIETSKPQTNGILRLNHTKKILDSKLEREDVKELVGIKNGAKVEFTKNSTETDSTDKKTTTGTANTSKEIKLKETESKASISLENKTLLVSEDEQDLQMTVVLDSSDESKDLYKNPTITITLPSQITSMTAKCKILYGNGLELEEATATKVNGKEVITIKLKGEQEKYPEEAVSGTKILVYAKVKLDKLSTNTTENIILKYTNENAVKNSENQAKAEINIVSESSMILTNNIEAYGVTTVGDEGTKEVSLDVNAESKNATVEMQVINNEETEISDVTILGSLPVSEDNITRTSEIQTNVEAKIYYTTVENPTTDLENSENGWTTVDSKDATSYMVVIDELEQAEIVSLSYDISVEEDLDYGVYEEASYSVSYMNAMSNNVLKANATTLSLSTDEQANLSTGDSEELKMSVSAMVGNKNLNNGDEVNSGEIIVYTVNIENTGEEDAKDVDITITIPEKTTLVEYNEDYATENGTLELEKYLIDKTDNIIKLENEVIKSGDTYSYRYMVRVNSNVEDEKKIQNNVQVMYKEEINTILFESILKKASLILKMAPTDRKETDGVFEDDKYDYTLKISNNSDKDELNVEVNIDYNEMLSDEQFFYYEGENRVELTGNKFTIDNIPEGESKTIYMEAIINKPTDELKYTEIVASAKSTEGDICWSNKISEKIEEVLTIDAKLEAKTTSNNTTGYLNVGDEIVYTISIKNTSNLDATELEIKDNFSDYLDLEKITLNGEVCEYEKETQYSSHYNILIVSTSLKAKESLKVEITAKVNDNIKSEEVLEIINMAKIYGDGKIVCTEEVTYYLENNLSDEIIYVTDPEDPKDQTDQNDPGETENPENPGGSTDLDNPMDPSDPDNSETLSSQMDSTKRYVISGVAWLDENKNGMKDNNEKRIEGMKVYPIDIQTNRIAVDVSGNEIIATTNSEGLYTLSNVPEGNYIIAFEYDTGKYNVTLYQVEGILEDKSSDAIKSEVSVNGETKTLGVTDTIKLTSNVANINIGLMEAKVFDLELEKTVSKIIVTNKSGTETKEFDNTDLAKVEIAAKYLSGSNVVIEYKIRVTNNGEVAGYARNIVDYIPSSLNFSSSMNPDWYKQGEYIYNTSLTNTKIEAGETKELTLILTKTMTESNTGVINNRAEIAEAYNSSGLDDMDSTPGNKEKGEDDFSSADVIIGVKTGEAIGYVTFVFIIIAIITGIAYLISRKFFINKTEI